MQETDEAQGGGGSSKVGQGLQVARVRRPGSPVFGYALNPETEGQSLHSG